MRNIQDFVVG